MNKPQTINGFQFHFATKCQDCFLVRLCIRFNCVPVCRVCFPYQTGYMDLSIATRNALYAAWKAAASVQYQPAATDAQRVTGRATGPIVAFDPVRVAEGERLLRQALGVRA